jgi:hypothetical protein
MGNLKLLIPGSLLLLTGCGQSGGANWAQLIQSAPVHLDAEYVVLTQKQVDCGAKEDLWDPPATGGARSTARLTQKGRDLKFSDDVSIGDMKFPYVQVRGDFTLSAEIQSDREGPDPQTRLVEAKLGVPIQHSCFPNPLPMMGVRKGNFSQDDSPQVLLRNVNNVWSFDRIQH